jgi:thiamine-phosphate pyrophosphorylase
LGGRPWLVSDARNDARLEAILRRLPPGSGLIFRHYHLPERQRRARWEELRRLCRARGVLAVLASTPAQARRWRADGAYGLLRNLAGGPPMLRLATAHGLRELGQAARHGADAALLSPVYPTRSHPGAPGLGPMRFRALAARSPLPVLALGGMNRARARHLRARGWAAIDGI